LKSAIGIIPARYQSTRFPGKPLAHILGKPMIQWVYERASMAKTLKKVIVATDDTRIIEGCHDLGIPVVMTSIDHRSGTDRVAEAAYATDFPLVVNIQGDEPLLEPSTIDGLVEALQDDSVVMASVMTRIVDADAFVDQNKVKVVVDTAGNALYFSRCPIPSGSAGGFFLHIGLYGYQREFLFRFCSLGPSPLEKTEKLEQLRALEHGFKIKMIESGPPTLSVDTPQDIIKIENHLKEKRL
jgi:3-deoxy-manno-octulosonate cytidylyltransferase (CMP-KDO synthetase)